MASCGDIFLGVLAIFFPPIAVWIKRGLCSADSLINILLCCLGYLPGLLHSWYIISSNPERDYDYEALPDGEGGNQHVTTYYYIRHEPSRREYGTQQQGAQGQNRPAPPPPKSQNKPANKNTGGQVGSSSSAPQVSIEGPSVGAGTDQEGAPPAYADVVRGDNKVQSQD
ncbi:hypothetical protein LTR84_009673 [Exophiala bonariae]|uniref:Stress response RCI peptide n=1 Tax=Exophiala bonariae TaxID=1690606 RepID=A0AAV9NMK9_9EURO|nr:hypothetical protein LTR84_009673 [Exophiala bonariae]